MILAIANLRIPEGLGINCPYYTTTDKNNLTGEGAPKGGFLNVWLF